MNREELQKYVKISGYSLGQIEKDYFQHIVLNALSRKAAGHLIFKGGTALQKIGITHRFSEDLDFTLRKIITASQMKEIAIDAIKIYNYIVESDRIKEDERTISFRLKIQGPLTKQKLGVCTIRIETSIREQILKKPVKKELTPIYADILPYVLDVMALDEILAEKIRTIYTRQKARDLYDLYKLAEINTPFDVSLINKKLDYYKLSFDKETFLKKCQGLQAQWTDELRTLIGTVVPYQHALDLVKTSINYLEKK